MQLVSPTLLVSAAGAGQNEAPRQLKNCVQGSRVAISKRLCTLLKTMAPVRNELGAGCGSNARVDVLEKYCKEFNTWLHPIGWVLITACVVAFVLFVLPGLEQKGRLQCRVVSESPEMTVFDCRGGALR